MTSKDIDFFCRRFSQLQSERSPDDVKWRAIAQYMRHVRAEFTSVYDKGELPPEISPYITSGIAQQACDNFVGGIYGYLSNEATQWLGVETYDDDLNKFHSAKLWLSTVSRKILNSCAPGMANFYGQVPDYYADLAAMGNAGMLPEFDRKARRFHDLTYSPFDLYFDEDHRRQVDTVYRPMWFTKRQMQMQGWTLPPQCDKAGDDQRFLVVHVVVVNENYSDATLLGDNSFAYSDIYFMLNEKHMLQKGGRRDFYLISRWGGSRKYGFGLGHKVLPDAKTANAMDRALLEYAEHQAHPTPLLPDRNEFSRVRPQPRKPIYGGMSIGGRPMVSFLSPQGNIGITLDMLKQREEQIREGFYFSLMQMAGRSGMTVVETLARDEQRMRMIAPYLGNIQVQFLTPFVFQRFANLHRLGQLPPPPKELHGQELKVKYVSPLANAQKSAQAAGTVKLIDAVVMLSKTHPEVADVLDADAAVRSLQEAFTAPPDVLRSPEAIEELRAMRQQQMQMQQALEMGQQGADIAQKVSTVAHARNDGMLAA